MTTTATAPNPIHHLAPAATPTSTTDTSTTNAGYPIPRGPVTSTLSFYAPPTDGSKPFNYVEEPPAGVPQRNFGQHEVPITINDIRGRESAFNLDSNAFSTLQGIESSATDFTNDADIKSTYYPEVEQLLLAHVPGAQRILLFDHTIRRADPHAARAPVTQVHIDQTRASAAQRVQHHLPAEAAGLLSSRYRIINVWRPLNGPVLGFPLAVADSATVADEDLVGVEHRYPLRTGETAAVCFNPGQQWFYWSGMRNDERLLLKCFDSDPTHGPRGRVPHTAFVDPRTPAGAPGRESIEVRALVFG